MDRETREELKALSKELLGSSSRYQKLLGGKTSVNTEEKTSNGRPIRKAVWMSEEELLEELREMKREKEEKALASKVQQQAGGKV